MYYDSLYYTYLYPLYTNQSNQGMGGGKGERKNRRDQASDGSEGGRSLVSPQKAERDRAREVCFDLLFKQQPPIPHTRACACSRDAAARLP